MTASAPSFGHWSHEGRTSETGCGFIRTCIVIGRSLAGSIHFRADGRLERHARGLARGFRSRHFSGQIFHDGKPDSAVPRALAKKRHSKLRSPGPEEPDRLMGPPGWCSSLRTSDIGGSRSDRVPEAPLSGNRPGIPAHRRHPLSSLPA